MTQYSQNEERILSLLGQGLSETTVASAVGVTVARISQMLSDEQFRERVAELRYNNLAAATGRDNKYDSIEDSLLVKLEASMGMMFRPMEILKALQIVNTAKRRGQGTPEHMMTAATVIQLQIPTKVVNNFLMSANRQVVSAGDQELVTMQSSRLLQQLKDATTIESSVTEELNYASPDSGTAASGGS